jgi:hypothetical protein
MSRQAAETAKYISLTSIISLCTVSKKYVFYAKQYGHICLSLRFISVNMPLILLVFTTACCNESKLYLEWPKYFYGKPQSKLTDLL